MRTVNIFGVTGSIGKSTLEVLKFQSSFEEIKIKALTSNNNVDILAKNALDHNAEFAVVANPDRYQELKDALFGSSVVPLAGTESLIDVAQINVDWTMNAIVGFAGLEPSIAIARTGKVLALANKESIVCGGDFLMNIVKESGSTLLPVDSEHSAVYQCLKNEKIQSVEKIILTASGGPFRKWTTNEIQKATLDQAVAHPNWTMGTRISIDSATMFNKALEVIEAKYLFNVPIEDIEVVVHPESIVHSMVRFNDGSVIAQLGTPDMKGAISYALNHPERLLSPIERLDLTKIGTLNFEEVNLNKFPALDLAYSSLKRGALLEWDLMQLRR